MSTNSNLRLAIKYALGTSAALALSVVPNAFAQDAADDSQENLIIEEVMVTGSRIVRTDRFDAGGQVVTIDAAAIEALSALNMADVLRSSPLNAYGSFSERSGSSAGSNATFDLRGLGSSRTLVMVDGMRLPGSPNLGADSVNINMLPMTSIQRIDILADGASAVYGADAVAGVVNLVTYKRFEGMEVRLRYGDRDRDDGGDWGASILAGTSSDRGNVVVAFEYSHRDAIFDADREFTAPWIEDFNGDGIIDTYDETDGISYYGRTWNIYDDNDDIYRAAADCPTTGGFVGIQGAANLADPDGTICAFAYAGVSANRAELDKVNSYMYADYEVSDNHTMYMRALFSRVESFGRYAPPAARWNNPPEDHPHNPFDIDQMIADGEISADYDLTATYRWTNIGTRDDNTKDTQWDIVTGFKGDLTDNITYDTYLQAGEYDSTSIGTYYLSYTGLDYVLANGLDPFSPEGAGAMRASPLQINTTEQMKAYGHIQFDTGDLWGAGTSTALVGVEYVDYKFINKFDAASEAGLIGGSAGNSSAGERDFASIFFEWYLPLTENMELQVAGRYDDYSDFGGNFSRSLSWTWNALDNLTVRARWGEGFKAPSLANMYGPETFSAETAYDPVTDTRRQFDTYYNQNPDLEAEESESISLGLNWEFLPGHAFDIAYYDVTVENVITQPSTQSLFYADAFGQMWDPNHTRVERSGTGNVQAVYSYATNGDKLQVTGIDFQWNSLFDTSFGMWALNAFWSHQLEYKVNAYFNGGFQDTAGFYLQPQDRAQGSIIWDLGDFGVDIILNYIGEHSEEDNLDQTTGVLTTSSNNLDSWTTMDMAFRWDGGAYGQFKIGANNVTDEDPVLDIQGKYADGFANLYDAIGRVYFIEYKKAF